MPDLAGWRRERMSRLPDAAYFDLAPDWVCEILSPSTEGDDRADKMPIYAREAPDWVCEVLSPSTASIDRVKKLAIYRP